MVPKRIARRFLNSYFNPAFDLRIHLFNILALAGVIVSLVAALSSYVNGESGFNIVSGLLGAAIAAALLLYASRSGRYQLCYSMTIALVFFLLFPAIFFTGGGMDSSMPFYFIFAILFTIFMLDGKKALLIAVLELLLYTGLCLFAWQYPAAITPLPSPEAVIKDRIVGLVAVSLALGSTMFLHFRAYIKLLGALEKQNIELAEADRTKTEFLQDIGHEIRNPLQAISYGIDFVRSDIGEQGGRELQTALHVMQNETVRLGLMINGMVELATMSGSAANREKLDFAAMLRRSAESLRLACLQAGNTLHIDVAPDLPPVYAIAEQLERVPINLLQNALDATRGGRISLRAVAENHAIALEISDNGAGIPPELLSQVFDRGIGSKGGKGYGLSICKTIVEAHGGTIQIESEAGRGSTVRVTIPAYGGQSEVRV